MDAQEWLTKVSGGATVNAAATRSGVSQKTLSNQIKAGEIKAEMAIPIARAYKSSPVAALVDLGIIDDDEARDAAGLVAALDVVDALRRASAEQLAYEIGERLAELERRRNDDDDEGGTPAEEPDPSPKPAPGAGLPTLAQKRAERTYAKPGTEAARPKKSKPKMGDE